MNFFRRPETVGNRVVRANDAEANKLFPSNAISNTKYNLLSFVPKNLMEQFSRAMNKYFLLIACLQLVKEITPVNPLTTWLPLAVIFGVTAVKEGWDDLGRRKADNAANARTYTVVRGGRRQEVQSRDVHVGDIMMLRANDEVPADLVILSSSDPKGNCFIQTTNLDGESNLKVRSALPATAGLVTEGALGAFRGSVECAPPNEHIYKFDSQLRTGPGAPVQALSSSQLLLQATHLRNTDWVYGLAVYTGNETKFGKNKKSPPTKYTRTDGFINSISAAVFLLQLMLVAVFGAVGDVWNEDSGVASWYLQIIPLSASPFYQPLVIPARFLLLNSTMIPISLKLTLDLCKLAYANYINADVHLFPAPEPGVTAAPNPMRSSAAAPAGGASSSADAHSGEPAPVGAVSNSTALSEDLGQVKYVLTDKTGTLTENKMVLQVATVCGVQYGRFDAGDGEGLSSAPDSAAHAPPSGSMPHSLLHAAAGGIMADMRLYDAANRDAAAGRRDACALEFLRTLALNNDVVPSTGKDGGRVYKASSPDEEALVKAAAAYGVALVQREGDDVTIEALRHEARETYRQLACFEFSSDRKRMSVILRNLATQELRLYCKGADDMVMARLAPGQEAAARGTQAQIDAYASAGLRTLVYAYKDLSEAQYATFKASFDAASADMTDRDAAKERVYTSMEEGLLLIGATAIEDKLQDCVPETIALLKEAGIAFWMLTGDKFSTALTIAKTCNLKPAGNSLIEIDGESASEVKPSLDMAAQGLQRQGYQLAYEPIATGWSATLSTLSLGFAGGRTTALPPHRPTGAAAAHAPVPDTATMVAVNPLGAGVAAASSATPRSGRAASPAPFTVIVRGATLAIIFADERLMARFGAICLSADSVICCRVTPKQKGQLVRLVKDAGHMTLAIGDGGNDVAMIQEAAVGVGIRGKEGLQASRASDYSVAFFRSLQRLLLVHGRYSYYRTCVVAQYSFYKSFLFCVMQIMFGFFSGYAGVSFFNSLCVAAYNVVVFVPIVFFMTDRDVSQATALALPEAYRMCNEGTMMTAGTMAAYMLRGLWQAVLTVLVAVFAASLSQSADYESLGLLTYFAYMWVQDLTMLLLLRRVNWMNLLSVFGMHALAFAGMLLVNFTTAFQSFIDYGSLTNTAKDPVFWLSHLLIAAACVLPVEALRWWRFAFGSSFASDVNSADDGLDGLLGPQRAAGVGGAGHAWKSNVLTLGRGGGSLSSWVRAMRGGGRGATSTDPTRPLLAPSSGGVGGGGGYTGRPLSTPRAVVHAGADGQVRRPSLPHGSPKASICAPPEGDPSLTMYMNPHAARTTSKRFIGPVSGSTKQQEHGEVGCRLSTDAQPSWNARMMPPTQAAGVSHGKQSDYAALRGGPTADSKEIHTRG